MRLRKSLTGTICARCTLTYLCNDNEVAPDVVRCPRCGHEAKITYPPAVEEELGCGPLIVAAVIFFVLATLTGGGGISSVLFVLVLGIGVPFGIAVLAYHPTRLGNGD